MSLWETAFSELRLLFFLSNGLKCSCVSVCELGPPIWRRWAAFFSRFESGNQISFFLSPSSLLLLKTFHFSPPPFSICWPLVRIRYGVDSRAKNQNHALDFWGTERTITHVWERQKGVAICFRQHARYTVLSSLYKLSTSPTGWFSLGCGDWAIAMTGCTAGYDVSSCATAVWHIARLGPKILSWVKQKLCRFGIYTWNHLSVFAAVVFVFFKNVFVVTVPSPPPAARSLVKAWGTLSFGNCVRQPLRLQHLQTAALHNGTSARPLCRYPAILKRYVGRQELNVNAGHSALPDGQIPDALWLRPPDFEWQCPD